MMKYEIQKMTKKFLNNNKKTEKTIYHINEIDNQGKTSNKILIGIGIASITIVISVIVAITLLDILLEQSTLMAMAFVLATGIFLIYVGKVSFIFDSTSIYKTQSLKDAEYKLECLEEGYELEQ